MLLWWPTRSRPPPADSDTIISRLLSLVSGNQDERDRRRLLKAIGCQLRKTGGGLLSPKGDRVLPGLGKLFYGLYKALGPAQELLRSADSSQTLKSLVIEQGMTETGRELAARLSPSSLKQRFAELGAELITQTQGDLKTLAKEFPTERVAVIAANAYQLERLLDLVNFDFYFLLKKLDARFPEQDYGYQPSFQPTAAADVAEDLQDFLELLMHLDTSASWEDVLAILNAYKSGTDVFQRSAFSRTMATLTKIKKNRILQMLVQLIQSNPFYKPGVTKPERQSPVQDYVGRVKTQAELTLTQLNRERRGQRVEALIDAVFGKAMVPKLEHYTEENNLLFGKRQLSGYSHVPQITYLRAFLLGFATHEVEEQVNLLLVKGKWADNNNSRSLSDAYQSLAMLLEEIAALDESLGDDGQRGGQLRSILVKCDRAKKYGPARRAIAQINDLAKNLMAEAMTRLLALAREFKLLIEDASQPGGQRLMNWAEVRSEMAAAADTPNPDATKQLSAVYKRISAMYRLLELMPATSSGATGASARVSDAGGDRDGTQSPAESPSPAGADIG